MDLFKITAAVMHWGNQKWKQKPREEQAEVDGPEDITKVSQLLGTEVDSFINGLLKPRIKVILKSNLFKKKSLGNQFKLIWKVGNEFVNKGQNQAQVYNACAALSKAIYARSFNWIVDKCNETLDVKTIKRAYFIGVLDIAGFETFEVIIFNLFNKLMIR